MTLKDDFKSEVESNKIKKEDTYLIVNGEAIDGDSKERHFKLISYLPDEISRHGEEILKPILDEVGYSLYTQGTPAHVGKSANLEESMVRSIGDKYKVIRDERRNTNLWNWFYGDIGGVLYDIKHECSVGKLPWTFENIINRDRYRLEQYHRDNSVRMPNIILRSMFISFIQNKKKFI